MTTPESGPPQGAQQYPGPGQAPQYGAPGQAPQYPQPGPQYGAPGQGPQYPQPGPQYGAPGQAPQYPQAGPPYGAPAPTPSKGVGKRILLRIVVAVAGLAIVSGVGYGWKVFKGESPDLAKVGDCMAGTDANNLKVVKCTDAKANYKVIGKVNDTTEIGFQMNRSICKPFQGAESAFWKGKKLGTGYVLCLAPAK
ncbi:MAG: hypothetical protein JWN52_2985 [Actinomycetia bacterium]|nr:hypothetical protein [Actinomycetes bacterium]